MAQDNPQAPASGQSGGGASAPERVETVLESTMTVEAVDALRDKAAADAIATDRKRSADLLAAFPDDPAYAAQCFTDGLSVDQAKAKRFDALVAENKTLKADNDALKKAAESSDNQGRIEFAPTDKPDSQAESDPAAVDAEALKVWNANEKLRAQFNGKKNAWLALCRNEPDVLQQYRK